MKSRAKRLAANSVAMSIRTFIVLFFNLYISRVALGLLGVESYAILALLTSVLMLGTFYTVVLDGAAQRFFAAAVQLGEVQKEFSVFIGLNVLVVGFIALTMFFVGAGYIFVFMEQGGYKEGYLFLVYLALCASLLVSLAFSPIFSLFLTYEKVGYIAFFQIFELLLKVVLLKIMLCMSLDSLHIYVLSVLVSALFARLSVIIALRKVFPELEYRASFGFDDLKRISHIVGWNIVGALAYTINNHGVSLLISTFFGLGVVAARALAVQVGIALMQFVSSLQSTFNPQLFKSYSCSDNEYLERLVDVNGRFLFFLVSNILTVLYLESSRIADLWLVKPPLYLSNFLPLLAVETLTFVITLPLVTIVQAVGKIALYQIVVGGTMLLSLPLLLIVSNTVDDPRVIYYVGILVSILCSSERLWFVSKLRLISVRRYLLSVIVRGGGITLVIISIASVMINNANNLIFNLFVILTISISMWLVFGVRFQEWCVLYDNFKRFFGKLNTHSNL